MQQKTMALMLTMSAMSGSVVACGAAGGESTGDPTEEVAVVVVGSGSGASGGPSSTDGDAGTGGKGKDAGPTYTHAQLITAQREADLVSRAILTGSTAGLPTSGACSSLVPAVNTIIKGLVPSNTFVSPHITTILGLQAAVYSYYVSEDSNLGAADFNRVNTAATTCWGGAVADFIFFPSVVLTQISRVSNDISDPITTWELDPAVANLGSSLGATAGSSAAAVFSDNPDAGITVYQLPNTATTIATLPSGAPALPSGASTNCSSIGQAAPAGQAIIVTGSIQQNSKKSFNCTF